MKIKNFKLKINFQNLLIGFLLIYFVFFTFYNLNWGAPFYFHPDERNVASSISQLNLFENLNPKFFAYGQLPIYTVYLLGSAKIFLTTFSTKNLVVPFDQAIIIGRLLSAFLTIALVFLIYKATLELKNRQAAFLAFILSATSVAFFQFSHYGTFEIWLSLFYLLDSFALLKFLKTKKSIYLYAAAAIFGICVGLKLSSLAFAPVILYSILINAVSAKIGKRKIFEIFKYIIEVLFFSLLFYILTSPFNFLDTNSFINSMKYESQVATGTLPVFYTGEFYNQIPILFQFTKELPFLVNPFVTILGLIAIFYLTYKSIKIKDKFLPIFLISFGCIFLSSAFLFAKWERYIVPSISYIYILTAIFIVEFVKNKRFLQILYLIFALIGLVFSFSFLKTVRLDTDSRVAVLNFAKKNIPPNSKILSEVYDLGIVPFNSTYPHISLFNFYDLDNGDSVQQLLPTSLNDSNYIILPSQRIYESRMANSKKFPNGYKFYSDLFSQKNGFVKIYETPCDIFCKVTYMGNPVFNEEQTVNVFDRPQVYVFKRTK